MRGLCFSFAETQSGQEDAAKAATQTPQTREQCPRRDSQTGLRALPHAGGQQAPRPDSAAGGRTPWDSSRGFESLGTRKKINSNAQRRELLPRKVASHLKSQRSLGMWTT